MAKTRQVKNMELLEAIALAERKFDREVKPNIGSENMAFIAQMEMLNVVDYLSKYSQLIIGYHNGPTLLAKSRIIRKIYESNEVPDKRDFEEFRASLAQTRLAIQTNNT